MSSTTLRWGHGNHGTLHPPPGHRTLPMHLPIGLIVAGACAAMIFAVAAPFAGSPAGRLLSLDDKPTVLSEFDRPSERTPPLSPSNQWVTVDTIDPESTPVLNMPALDVRGDTNGP